MKRYITLCLLCMVVCATSAQDARERYKAYVESCKQNYKQYVDARNAEYINYMRSRWREVETTNEIAPPPQPRPKVPVILPEEPSIQPMPTSQPVPQPQPKPIVKPEPVAKPTTPSATDKGISFCYFGTDCSVAPLATGKPRLKSCTEDGVATLWESFASTSYKKTLADCTRLRDEMRLGDWGYLQLLAAVATAWYGEGTNEATLLQTFLAVQSGYGVRMAYTADRLSLLFATNEQVYGRRYVAIDGVNYYLYDTSKPLGRCRMFDRAFPGERRVVLSFSDMPLLTEELGVERTLQSRKYPLLQLTFAPNVNLLGYLTAYPDCDLDVYRYAHPSGTIKKAIDAMRPQLSNKNETEQIAMILDFVQTALAYKTDGEQFGRERTFFADETLAYPYCDCEDRAILFATMVEQLASRDVVLLQYPGHVAAAVRFKGECKGDAIMYKGGRYVVCDPTYIGAGIGRTMPDMDNSSAKIISR